MAQDKQSVKHPVGKFSITDENGALIINAVVEVTENYTDAAFWLECRPFKKGESYISVAFDAVSLRAFASQLKELQYQTINKVQKFSGGKKMVKTLIVSIIERYCSFEFKEQETLLYFRLPTNYLYGLAAQIEHLVNTAMDATYKTQQFNNRKRKK